jgi:antitoxin VapB
MRTLLNTSKPKDARLFRNNRSQAVRISVEFELQGDRVMIHRGGGKLIIEPITQPTNVVELLAMWKMEAPLGPEDQLPEIKDLHA